MPLRDEIVLPSCAALGLPVLGNLAVEHELCVPFVLDAATSARTLVRIVTNEASQDLQLWADIGAVTSAARPRMLELVNRLNSQLRWLKFTLMNQLVLVEVDIALQASRDPRGQFTGMFVAFLEALGSAWPEVVRTASRRGKRSRLERELAGLLTPPGPPAAG